MKIELGGNVFEECETPISIGENHLFDISPRANGTIVVSLDVPSPPAAIRILVRENLVQEGAVEVRSDLVSLSLLLRITLVLHVRRQPEATFVVDLDLRPAGLSIFTDEAGLHLGTALLARNHIRGCKVGIRLPPPAATSS